MAELIPSFVLQTNGPKNGDEFYTYGGADFSIQNKNDRLVRTVAGVNVYSGEKNETSFTEYGASLGLNIGKMVQGQGLTILGRTSFQRSVTGEQNGRAGLSLKIQTKEPNRDKTHAAFIVGAELGVMANTRHPNTTDIFVGLNFGFPIDL